MPTEAIRTIPSILGVSSCVLDCSEASKILLELRFRSNVTFEMRYIKDSALKLGHRLGHEDSNPYLNFKVSMSLSYEDISHFSAVHLPVRRVVKRLLTTIQVAVRRLGPLYDDAPHRLAGIFLQLVVRERGVNPT